MFEDAVGFLRNCKGKNIVIYDTDGDGIGAAVIVSKTLKRIFNKYPKAIPGDHDMKFLTKDSYDEISKQKVDNIIIVDMPVDKKAEYILRLSKRHKILILDHHQTNKNMNRHRNIVHVNPSLWNSRMPSSRYPTSKIAFDVCKNVADIKDLDWIAGMGIIGDYAGSSWKIFLNSLYKKYPYLKGENNYSFDNKLGYINHLITSVYKSKRSGAKLGFDVCMKAESPLDVIRLKSPSAKKMKKMYDVVEREIRKIMKTWRNKADINKNKRLIILKLDTTFPIQSTISTKISIEKPDHTIVVAIRTGSKIHISFRRQDGKVDCGKLARSATRNLRNANGGGHAPAAGGSIMTRDWEKFKGNINRLL